MRLEQALIDRNNALDQLKYQKESSDRQYQEILIQLNGINVINLKLQIRYEI